MNNMSLPLPKHAIGDTAVDHIRYQLKGRVAWLTLDRPPLNVLDLGTLEQLVTVLRSLSDPQPSVRVVALAHAGELFSAGVDVHDHLGDRAERMLELFLEACRRLVGLPVPTVAAIAGAAIGGGFELALCCDLIVASDRARFSLPEIKVGTFPPVAVALLHEKLPAQLAAELIYAGKELEAARAHQLGLVNRLVAAVAFEAELNEFVQSIACYSGAVLRAAKRAAEPARTRALQAVSYAERVYREELSGTADMSEGLDAFLQKRQPVWRDT